LLDQRPQANTVGLELRGEFDEVPQATAETSEPPHHQRVVRREELQALVEPWTVERR
jgi:hypothetical protein